jgi:hypothetical protein
MIFIPPMEIATRIMTLIDNSKTELVLVSPYINIDKWDKFQKCLQRAVDRGVAITIYTRENADQNLNTIRSYKVNLVLIKDLHAKIYLNESYAIASSQNLVQYSDSNSIDFGYSTEKEEERIELTNFIHQYLEVSKHKNVTIGEPKSTRVKTELIEKTNMLFHRCSEINEIYDAFKDRHKMVRMNNDKTYVFCTRLFPFADVMIKEGFELRFKNNLKDYNSILEILKTLDIKNNHYKYKKKLLMKNNHPSTLIFIPNEVTDIQSLISDYLFITKLILNKTGKDVLKQLI